MHHLIAIRGDMNEIFAKTANNQGNFFKLKLFSKSIENMKKKNNIFN